MNQKQKHRNNNNNTHLAQQLLVEAPDRGPELVDEAVRGAKHR